MTLSTLFLFFLVTPKFSVLPKNSSEAVEGYSVMIDCAAEGDPKPTIQWDKNSVMMNDLGNQRFVSSVKTTLKNAFFSA